MPSSSTSLTIVERGRCRRPAPRRGRRSRPSRSPSMMRCFEALARPASRSGPPSRPRRPRRPRTAPRSSVQRVVAVARAGRRSRSRRPRAAARRCVVQRHDARRVHDRGVEAGLAALVQEHAVEHVAGRGLEAERHVRQAEHRGRAGQLGLDAADRLDGLHRRRARRSSSPVDERERERVEDQVGRLEAVALDRRGRGCGARPAASTRRRGPGPPRR